MPATEGAADFLPYHRYYLAHQRDMAPPSRRCAPACEPRWPPVAGAPQLAALDGVLDQALAPASAPARHRAPAAGGVSSNCTRRTGRPPEPATTRPWLQPGGWLATFCQDMQAVLLAELDLRLQPVAGCWKHSTR
jgi:hypothetical protein